MNIKKQTETKKLILSALFLALCYLMPYLTGQIPEIGAALCPMHIPVLLCGFVCGPIWSCAVGLIAPVTRSVLTGGFPPMFPTAVCMAVELAAYGAAAGLMHKTLPKKKPFIYISLLIAMAAGRLVWGAAMLLCVGTNNFGPAAFFSGAVANALPGIILQIILVPAIVMITERYTK